MLQINFPLAGIDAQINKLIIFDTSASLDYLIIEIDLPSIRTVSYTFFLLLVPKLHSFVFDTLVLEN